MNTANLAVIPDANFVATSYAVQVWGVILSYNSSNFVWNSVKCNKAKGLSSKLPLINQFKVYKGNKWIVKDVQL